ncbi:hypothetical protein AAES_148019 [Amazona aestiva]|uniref:UBC core domain-containing protein n=1 Tax=Amazona aestiva TaxID=12930 RepID=A0A0Q3T3P7_AMAAE|nr:hypothetical protein AAES_148019 [Amazona aestiva]
MSLLDQSDSPHTEEAEGCATVLFPSRSCRSPVALGDAAGSRFGPPPGAKRSQCCFGAGSMDAFEGAWTPSLNISTLLTSIQLLMAEPNPDDPLMASISSEYKYKKELFLLNAREWTAKYASQQKRVRNSLRVLS